MIFNLMAYFIFSTSPQIEIQNGHGIICVIEKGEKICIEIED